MGVDKKYHHTQHKRVKKEKHFFIGSTCPRGTKESLITHNVQTKVTKNKLTLLATN